MRAERRKLGALLLRAHAELRRGMTWIRWHEGDVDEQARAYGVGIVVATQNPMDLDYRALSNAPLTRAELRTALAAPR